MIVSGVTVQDFLLAVEKANTKYDNNIQASIGQTYSKRGTRFSARVVLLDTGFQKYGKGTQLAPGQKRSAAGRRVNAVCWHVYRDVLVELFNINPKAHVKTMYAKYYGREQFYDKFPATAEINVGSVFQPACAADVCDCESD